MSAYANDRRVKDLRDDEWCGRPASPDSFYRWCTEHDQEAREDNPAQYGR